MRDKFDSCNQRLFIGGGRKTAQVAAITKDPEDQVIQRTPDLSDLSILSTITWNQASKLMFVKKQPNGSKSKAASSNALTTPVPSYAIRSSLSRLSLVSCSNLISLTVLQPLAPSLSHHLDIRLGLGSSGRLKGSKPVIWISHLYTMLV